MMAAASESRDFVGYGRQPPDPRWPSGARLALVIVLNVEEGAEPSIPDGDEATELALTDAIAGEVPASTRDLVAESLWEYGSRVGFWRLYELFVERRIPVTINACAQALERNAEAAAAIGEAGLRPVLPRPTLCAAFPDERGHRARRNCGCVRQPDALRRARNRSAGKAAIPPASARGALLVEHGGFLYDADSYADDLPYWVAVDGRAHLVVPHTFTNNDNRLPGWQARNQRRLLRSSGCRLSNALCRKRAPAAHDDGKPAQPRLRPACPLRSDRALPRSCRKHDGVWIAGRSAIARHWIADASAGGQEMTAGNEILITRRPCGRSG